MKEIKEHHTEELEMTYFADPRRAAEDLLEYQIDLACKHPITTSVMSSFSGIVLILNQHRQAVAVNDTFLRTLGIADPSAALGLRPGEAVDCIHAASAPNGCGTGKACVTCGAVLAILGSRKLHEPIERECLIAREHDGISEPLEFMVRASPLLINDCDFSVVTIADISEKKRAQAVERMFVHDLLNCIQGLQGMCEIVGGDGDGQTAEEMEHIIDLSNYLADLANAHRDLMLMESGEFRVRINRTSVRAVTTKVQRILAFNAAARSKSLAVELPAQDVEIETDSVLLSRVLLNMTKNAMEAASPEETVRLRCTQEKDQLTFSVWNPQEIPEHTAIRIFQRYFSTKTGNGRGLGTYSMKLIGERYLRGRVSFSSDETGTVFSLTIPQKLS